ncbi:DUF2141 domain-containing protein [Hyphomonas sp.]|uniref:DUF2141 domain-containing protein n=1 Tax=Hyphomonas sp. TaxID=87 RepID=UPI00391A9091
MNRLIAAASLAALFAAPAFAGTAEIEITHVQASAGPVYVSLFDEAGWRSSLPLKATSLAAGEETLRARFEDLAPGVYGVRIYQDVNGNGELDRGAMGLPKEPYGFSNDAQVRFGPPGWRDVSFEVSGEGAQQVIRLR